MRLVARTLLTSPRGRFLRTWNLRRVRRSGLPFGLLRKMRALGPWLSRGLWRPRTDWSVAPATRPISQPEPSHKEVESDMRTVVNKVSWVGDARVLAVILAAILALAILAPMRAARASNVISGASGPVSVEFVSADADLINTMSVTAPVDRVLFNTEESRIGTRVELGTFSSGTTFRFQLQAKTADGNFTWSSDPAQNSDGEDHLRVTELHDGDPTLDNRVYKLEWEDDEDLGDRDFNDAVAILRIGADSDGDGLYDDWRSEEHTSELQSRQ